MTISVVNANADNFQTWLNKTNELVTRMNTVSDSANTLNANAVTTAALTLNGLDVESTYASNTDANNRFATKAFAASNTVMRSTYAQNTAVYATRASNVYVTSTFTSNTFAKSWFANTSFAASNTDVQSHISNTAAHGTTGAMVGTTNVQTLTNKTVTAPTITLMTSTGPGSIDGHAIGATVANTGAFTTVTDDGNRVLTTGTRVLPIKASSFIPSLVAGPSSIIRVLGSGRATTAMSLLSFDSSTEQYASLSIPMPKSWDSGTVTGKFRWMGVAGSGNTNWGFTCAAVNHDQTLTGLTYGADKFVGSTFTAGYDHIVSSNTSTQTPSGTGGDATELYITVFRDAASANGIDSYTSNAELISFELYYNINSPNDD